MYKKSFLVYHYKGGGRRLRGNVKCETEILTTDCRDTGRGRGRGGGSGRCIEVE